MSIRYFIVGLQFFVVSVLANAQTLHSDSLTLDIFLEDFVSLKPVSEAKMTGTEKEQIKISCNIIFSLKIRYTNRNLLETSYL